MNHLKSAIRSLSRLFLGFIFAAVLFTGCSKDKDLNRINKEQAATIQSLNDEIHRLNKELDELFDARDELLNAKRELESKLQAELASGDMSVSMDDRGLILTVQNSILFSSGKAELMDSARGSLQKVGQILVEKLGKHMVYVEGHTDNIPIRVSGWRSNWELSTARATEVLHYFLDQKNLNPKQFGATGYGEFQPVADNSSETGRQKNRRVEIVISPRTIAA